MKRTVWDVQSVHQCNRCFDCTTLHPLVSVVRLDDARLGALTMRLGFYAVFLIEHEEGRSCCGCSHCDYADATMFFVRPGHEFELGGKDGPGLKGWLLAFHPDLLEGTALAQPADKYTYFLYDRKESLHLSLREKEQVVACLEAVDKELHHPVDRHSRLLLVRHIELLLDYCTRFYERQFIIREEKHKALRDRLDRFWADYVREGGLQDGHWPTEEACAASLHVSPQYCADLLQFQTGMSLPAYFRQQRMTLAKQWLQAGHVDVTAIARRLGFANVQQFSSCFKRMTGLAPHAYRLSRN